MCRPDHQQPGGQSTADRLVIIIGARVLGLDVSRLVISGPIEDPNRVPIDWIHSR